MPSGGAGEHVVLGVFGGYRMETLARDGSSIGNKIGNKSIDTSSKKIRSREKDEKVL